MLQRNTMTRYGNRLNARAHSNTRTHSTSTHSRIGTTSQNATSASSLSHISPLAHDEPDEAYESMVNRGQARFFATNHAHKEKKGGQIVRNRIANRVQHQWPRETAAHIQLCGFTCSASFFSSSSFCFFILRFRTITHCMFNSMRGLASLVALNH